MGADDKNTKTEGAPEQILTSKYPSITSLPKSSSTSCVQFILDKSKENIENGRTRWVTNTTTGEHVKLTDLEPFSRSVASAMSKRGMVPGDVAIYLTADVTRIYTIVIGVWRIGGIVHSSYPEDTQDTLLLRIQATKARWIFCDPPSVPQCKEAAAQVDWPLEIFTFGKAEGTTLVDELFLDDGSACPEKVPNPGLDEPVLVLCTSGTTGRSKGAVYTNKTMLEFFMNTPLIPETVKLPMFLMRSTHVLGLIYPLRNACMGFGCFLMGHINKENILNAIQEYKPATVFGFPTFLLMLTDDDAKNYDLSSLETITTGGMVVTENFYRAMATIPSLKTVINAWGLTECGMITSSAELNAKGVIRRIESAPKLTVGTLLPNRALKVIDLNTGLTLGPMERGELVVKSPTMASGYWKRPEESAATFQDGWLRSGDIGYYDNEGFIFIEDRLKETFKYFNNHICPSDLEAKILKHPAVADAAVFGIRDPNGGDHIPRALVVLKPGEKANPKEIREFTERVLAPYQKIRGGLYIVDSLPKTSTSGKVIKTMAAQIPLPEDTS